jgi:hypothetical protein
MSEEISICHICHDWLLSKKRQIKLAARKKKVQGLMLLFTRSSELKREIEKKLNEYQSATEESSILDNFELIGSEDQHVDLSESVHEKVRIIKNHP